MTYSSIRHRIRTGDVLLVEGRGLAGKLIRLFTLQTISHVGLLLRESDGGLWVAEMSGMHGGYRKVPASQWVEEYQGQVVYWGIAPAEVHLGEEQLREVVNAARGRVYSYWTLVSTWLAQLIGRDTPASLVCSTFVQQTWEAAGYKRFRHTADPGDIRRHCSSSARIMGE